MQTSYYNVQASFLRLKNKGGGEKGKLVTFTVAIPFFPCNVRFLVVLS